MNLQHRILQQIKPPSFRFMTILCLVLFVLIFAVIIVDVAQDKRFEHLKYGAPISFQQHIAFNIS